MSVIPADEPSRASNAAPKPESFWQRLVRAIDAYLANRTKRRSKGGACDVASTLHELSETSATCFGPTPKPAPSGHWLYSGAVDEWARRADYRDGCRSKSAAGDVIMLVQTQSRLSSWIGTELVNTTRLS